MIIGKVATDGAATRGGGNSAAAERPAAPDAAAEAVAAVALAIFICFFRGREDLTRASIPPVAGRLAGVTRAGFASDGPAGAGADIGCSCVRPTRDTAAGDAAAAAAAGATAEADGCKWRAAGARCWLVAPAHCGSGTNLPLTRRWFLECACAAVEARTGYGLFSSHTGGMSAGGRAGPAAAAADAQPVVPRCDAATAAMLSASRMATACASAAAASSSAAAAAAVRAATAAAACAASALSRASPA
jgi:trimeric autotransporter adhesin